MLEPVSLKEERGISSKYFDIKYRPGKNSKNSKLFVQSSSLLTYLALADIYRTEETYETVKTHFFEILSLCKTEEEIQEVGIFLRKTADIGGYANQFYEEVSKLLNSNGKEMAKQTLQKQKEEKRKPVSLKEERGISSKYFDIKYRPGKNSKNSKLFVQSSSLLTYLALADIYHTEKTYENLKTHFYEILSLCKTEEEIREVRTFLRQTADIGGYANQFYEEVSKLLNSNGKEMAKQALQKQKEEKRKPVSKQSPNGLNSAYFDMKYRPGRASKNLGLAISAGSLLTYLALADAYHTEESYQTLKEQFYKLLLSCKTEEEIREVGTFLRQTADIGGYANQFYDENSDYVNNGMLGVQHARQLLEEIEKNKKRNKEAIEDFNSNYTDACNRLESVLKSPFLEDEEIGLLLNMFYGLQIDLNNLSGKVDKKFLDETNNRLESQIEWVRNMAYSLEEAESISPKTF